MLSVVLQLIVYLLTLDYSYGHYLFNESTLNLNFTSIVLFALYIYIYIYIYVDFENCHWFYY